MLPVQHNLDHQLAIPMKTFLFIALVLTAFDSACADELLFPNSDFESGTLDGWTAEGEAFLIQPTKGDNTVARNREPSNLQGDWWIGGYEKYNGSVGKPGDIAGDGHTGTLTSQEFTIKKPYITFRIGAGNLPGKVGVRLLIDDKATELATGVDSETMVNFSADVKEYIGKTVRLQIFDEATGGWGNMTWGHATSPDMVHWTQHDHALLPYRVDRRTGTIFSGTAVIDHNNSLGKQVGAKKTICAFFTFAAKPAFYQAMAYSTDGGESFTYWNEGRPVVKNQGLDSGERDPKVFWHEGSQQWVMALWVERKPGRVRWFTSTNLVDWEFASDLMRDWAYECMDVVFLPVDADKNNMKCLIYDASFDYEIGTFDGKEFRAETETLKNVRGNFYAAQTFNQAPDGRVVQIGWMRGGPDSAKLFDVPHNQQLAFPCDLSLKTTPDGIRLFVWPIKEIESLVSKKHSFTNVTLTEGVNALAGVSELDLIDLEVTFSPGDADRIVFDLPRVSVHYDTNEQVLGHTGMDNEANEHLYWTVDKLAPRDGKVAIRLLVDRLTLEAYTFGGETFSAHYIHPNRGPEKLSIHAESGTAQVHELTIQELKSAWKQ